MALKTTLEDTQDRLEALLTYANSVTGASDTSLGDAIETLCMGYGVLSAIYTQTVPVHTDDKLDILKQDLIVKETFSDGTTEEISNYTLSGDLSKVGDTTITVNFGRRKTTFTANVSEPSTIAYQLPQPVVFDGTKTIDTGVYLFEKDWDFTIAMHVTYNREATWAKIFFGIGDDRAIKSVCSNTPQVSFLGGGKRLDGADQSSNIIESKVVFTHAKSSDLGLLSGWVKKDGGSPILTTNLSVSGSFTFERLIPWRGAEPLVIGGVDINTPSLTDATIHDFVVVKGIMSAEEIEEYLS